MSVSSLSELRISGVFPWGLSRLVWRHRELTDKCLLYQHGQLLRSPSHPGETHECFFKRTGKEMPVVVPPKNVEPKVVDILRTMGRTMRRVWVPKPKLVYKQPSPEEIHELQMMRLAELEKQDQKKEEDEANKLADELDVIIRRVLRVLG